MSIYFTDRQWNFFSSSADMKKTHTGRVYFLNSKIPEGFFAVYVGNATDYLLEITDATV
jgi:predicted nucleic acid-binding Zn finger protein